MPESYFDLSEHQRAALSEEDVNRWCDVELMRKGILKPTPPPKIADIERDLRLTSITYYGLDDIVFETQEQAQAFMDLNPLKVTCDWKCGHDRKFTEPINKKIAPIALFKREEIFANAKELSRLNERKTEIEGAENAYRTKCDDVSNATSNIWSDWFQMKKLADRYKKIMDTKAEYVRLAGNEATADQFLAKAFPAPEIEAAKKWFEEEAQTYFTGEAQ